MNAVEIEEAVSALVAEPFNAAEFPYQFLAAFGFKDTTVKKLKAGASNTSDVPGAVLLRSNVHLIVTDAGKTTERLHALKASQKTAKGKVKFVLATDGELVEAEELSTGEPLACPYTELANHFGFFLPLAGISTVAEIKENPIDIKATGRLNKLYVELLKDNEDWGSDAKRQELNQFMARLIFCFFAEDTGIFLPGLFTSCLKQMTDPQSSNTHEVIQKLFQAMDTPIEKRKDQKFPSWADQFPYVNGRLFTEQTDVPPFSKMARSYLLRAGELDWQQINPDIFGSMIQAVADDDERGSLGMHYTSVPNILKVLNPLFLDDLREQLEEAAGNPRKLLNLRKRIAAIRVFDPACGSGNFLVIAYLKLREIESEIVRRRNDDDKKSWIKLTNFYGVEIKSFPAEIARLALLIAEFQCNVRYIGQLEACLDVLPLHDTGKIVTGNALRLDWISICPPTGTGIKHHAEDLLRTPLNQARSDFEKESGETYICGNPPYLGQAWQDAGQKADLANVLGSYKSKSAAVDYVSAWFIKAAEYNQKSSAIYAFVSTNSMWQGQQVTTILREFGQEIIFAEPSFKWKNLASYNAGVIVSIVGIGHNIKRRRIIYEETVDGQSAAREVSYINPYLVQGPNVVVESKSSPVNGLSPMLYGNQPRDGGHLCLEADELRHCRESFPSQAHWFKQYVGSAEMIRGQQRGCIWIPDEEATLARNHAFVGSQLERVRKMRSESRAPSTQGFSSRSHRFVQIQGVAKNYTIAVAKVSSERRRYIPSAIFDRNTIISDLLFGIYDTHLKDLSDNTTFQKNLQVIVSDVNPENVTGDDTANTLYGGFLPDTLNGGGGDDTLRGNADEDTLIGGAGDDWLLGDGGPDTAVFSGNRVDYSFFGPSQSNFWIVDSVEGRDGTDHLNSIEFLRFADGTVSVDEFTNLPPSSVSFANVVSITEGPPTTESIKVADIVVTDPTATNNRLSLVGRDAALFEILSTAAGMALFLKAGVLLDATTMTDLQVAVAVDDDTIPGTPDAVSDTLVLAIEDDPNFAVIRGTAANETLNGTAGDDYIDGQGGEDSLRGGAGNDTYIVDSAKDKVVESKNQGTDTVLSSVTHTLSSYVENLTLTGDGNINGTGNSAANVIIGNAGDNVLKGGSGDDTIFGGAGNDRIDGDSGKDLIDGGDGNDYLDGDSGTDTVSYASATAGVTVNLGLKTAQDTGGAGIDTLKSLENVSGSDFADSLTGAKKGFIDGGLGADTMSGGKGDNTYFVDDAGDQVFELAKGGTDTVMSQVSFTLGDNVERLTLTGTDAIDGTGNALDNRIAGNSAANVLTGGAGKDAFIFNTAWGNGNVDHITDFSVADDTMHIDNAWFIGVGGNGSLSSKAFVFGAVAADSSDRIIYDDATGALYFDADGSGAGAQVQFAQLDAHLALTNRDFLIV